MFVRSDISFGRTLLSVYFWLHGARAFRNLQYSHTPKLLWSAKFNETFSFRLPTLTINTPFKLTPCRKYRSIWLLLTFHQYRNWPLFQKAYNVATFKMEFQPLKMFQTNSKNSHILIWTKHQENRRIWLIPNVYSSNFHFKIHIPIVC